MKELTPLNAIRKNCLECQCGSLKEVRKCDIDDCPLHPFRFGKNPNRRGLGWEKNLISKKDDTDTE